jgi:hypothetical protein
VVSIDWTKNRICVTCYEGRFARLLAFLHHFRNRLRGVTSVRLGRVQ